ncbi:MAG TPA: thiamine pyrophosphate-dependent dehydrogenase E1 component subunit alpha [Verrucomicrobiae bacterium]|jgi:TPP-dependent pyruvate/acetoin dehydrogenase alpha subunit|nr:thiamine pyrophosphate-dependent dehydrogenase E1 component subunit alpha [Verrucomicrobiae bacterium]
MPAKQSAKLGKEKLIWMYTLMLRIREFEERVKRTFVEHPGVIRGHTHLADGAEASIVGALATRKENDLAMPSYRCHGYPIVLGTSVKKMMAEIYGRKDGLCQGFGGSMHLADPAHHFPGTSGIIAQAIAHATGAALTAQVKKTGQVVYCFFGDGASKQGAFFESLNMAAVWKLPIVYILENNQYQAYTHVSLEDANSAAGEPLSQKAKAFSMPGVTVDGTDPLKVYEAVGEAVKRARAGKGPSLVESKFYRFSAHGNAITIPPVPTQFPKHEAIEVYGRKTEFNTMRAKDPIVLLRKKLKAKGILSEAAAKQIEEAVRAEFEEAVQFALASPFPSPEDATKYVFA